jgi:hypothetical protein
MVWNVQFKQNLYYYNVGTGILVLTSFRDFTLKMRLGHVSATRTLIMIQCPAPSVHEAAAGIIHHPFDIIQKRLLL